MRFSLLGHDVWKLALLLALTVLVTWMIGPTLYLVSTRYDGKFIKQTIIIHRCG